MILKYAMNRKDSVDKSMKWLAAGMLTITIVFLPLAQINVPGTGSIAGTVLDSLTGLPVDSAKIVLYFSYYTYTMDGLVRVLHTIQKDSTETDTNGNYHFFLVDTLTRNDNASPYYWITATKEHYDTSNTGGFGVMSSTLNIENIVMSSMTGAIAGSVKDTVTMKAVPGARVILLKKTCSSSTAIGCKTVLMVSTLTDAQGHFAIANVPASSATISYFLQVISTGYQAIVLNNIRVVNKEVINLDIGVAPVLSSVAPSVTMDRKSLDCGMVALYDLKGRIIWCGATKGGRIHVPASVAERGTVFVAMEKNVARNSTGRVCRVFLK